MRHREIGEYLDVNQEGKTMLSRKKLPAGVILALVLMLGLAAVVVAQGGPAEQLRILTDKLRQVTNQELATGQKVQTERGVYLTGESATRVQALHQEAAQAYQAIIARPESEHQAAITSIRSFAQKPDLPVEYKSIAKSSYNNEVLAEYYIVGQDYYELDTRTNQVIQFGPASLQPGEKPKQYDTTPRYTPEQLEAMARAFIAERTKVDLTQLTPNHGNKGDVNFFFRWEDRTRERQDGSYPFIQVGFTRGGDLLSYTNSLDM